MGSPVSDPRQEALLYLRWMRGAAGRFYAGDAVPAGGGRSAVSSAGTTGLPGLPGRGGASVGRAPPTNGGALAPPTGGGVPAPRGSGRPGVPAGADSLRRGPSDLGKAAGPDAASADELDRLRAEAMPCRRCRLCETRTQVVFGEGSRRPRLMVIGEAPGADEDASGQPFVGRAGQLLTRMLAAIGLARADVYIANVVKCRPPDNRPPTPDEAAACRPFLDEQVRMLDPELLLLLGNLAAKTVLATDRGITALRGEIQETPGGRRAVPTFHPSYLLRNPEAKREAWLDLQWVARTLGLPLPTRPPDPPRVGDA